EDEQVIDHDGRAAVAVDRGEFQLAVAPEDLAGEVEAGGAHVAEMDEELLILDHRSGAGVAVLAVDVRGGGRLAEDGGVPEELAGLAVQAQGVERQLLVPGGDGRGEIDLAAGDDRRRPARAGDGLLPG